MKLIVCALAMTLSATTFLTAQAPEQLGKPRAGLVYEWKPAENNTDQIILLANGRQLGNWSIKAQEYWPLRGAGWGPACAPPFPVPEWANWSEPKHEKPALNFGIIESRRACFEADRGECRESIEINGQPASRAEAVRAIEKGVPEDGTKGRLTIIGSDAARARVEKDWYETESLKGLREKTLVWSVTPDHWSLRNSITGAPMFAIGGNPTVYYQDPTGKVIYHEDDYHGPADLQAIRRNVEAYEAKKDPGRGGFPGGVPPIYWILGGAAGAAGVLIYGSRGQHAANNPAG